MKHFIVMQLKFGRKKGHFSWRDEAEVAFQMGLEEWISLRKADMGMAFQMARRTWPKVRDEESPDGP